MLRRSNFAVASLLVIVFVIDPVSAAAPRERESLNENWRFQKGDPADAADSLSYAKLKPAMLEPGSATVPTVSCAQRGFDDGNWRNLDLPHDWGIEGPFDQNEPGETAKLPYAGVGWYRKHFTLPTSDEGRRIYLEVDGAMSYANVWINDHHVGGWPYGYTSWRVDLTPYLHFGGEENVIAIRLDNPPKSSRWYPGGGIYRNVWLTKVDPIHIAHWGARITTPNVTADAAEVDVAVQIDNTSEQPADVEATVAIYPIEFNGQHADEPVAEATATTLSIAAGATGEAKLAATVSKPNLWSPDTPHMYVAIVTLRANGKTVDHVSTNFGIRTIKFTPDEGFILNGESTEIRGVCLHHDLGALGAAFNLRARERQLELLKTMGCNAIRASHNPLEPEFYDLCDRLGFLVMDEAFDAWQMTKRDNDYHQLFDDWVERDLRAMIRRDANHPSVILWSLGNEIYEQREGKNAPLAKRLADIAHDEDPTRPVNMALHVVDASTNGFQNAVDVFGYNYTPFGYADFRQNNPKIPLIGSETSSCTSTRGEYFFPVDEADKRSGRFNFQVTSYDYSAPKWAMAPDIEFRGQDENPFVAGEFVWTGFDYLGEPTPYDRDFTASDATEMLKFTTPALEQLAAKELADDKKIHVPSRSSYFGIFDLCGFPKDRFYIYQARWRPDFRMAHILPHWNWPERVGQITPVHVYTSGDEAELFLNDRSLGRKQRGKFDYRLRWNDVKYEPGELKVVAYRDGEPWADDTVRTTGEPTSVSLSFDRASIRNDGRDLAFLTASIVDEGGEVVPRTNVPIEFEIDGPGEIVATDNGDATSHEPFQQSHRDSFNGLALAIVRAKKGERGQITVRAKSDGLESSSVTINVRGRRR
jgi:beta-galactosidase